jgi:hypothetical protein
MLLNLESSQKTLYRDFIKFVGKRKETGCESYFSYLMVEKKKHLALLQEFEEKNLIQELG